MQVEVDVMDQDPMGHLKEWQDDQCPSVFAGPSDRCGTVAAVMRALMPLTRAIRFSSTPADSSSWCAIRVRPSA